LQSTCRLFGEGIPIRDIALTYRWQLLAKQLGEC
jgi:hypothetical protein